MFSFSFPSSMEKCACVDISLKSKYVKVKWLGGGTKSAFSLIKICVSLYSY